MLGTNVFVDKLSNSDLNVPLCKCLSVYEGFFTFIQLRVHFNFFIGKPHTLEKLHYNGFGKTQIFSSLTVDLITERAIKRGKFQIIIVHFR